jgi:hypothetical protein
LVVATQLLFTTGDLMARANMRKHGFTLAAFIKVWFLLYMASRQLATVGQLYILATVLFGAASIVLANLLGVLLLGDILPVRSYAGITLAVLAFGVMSVTR